MTVFYLGPRALVTHDVFEVRGPQQQRFPIRELTHVRIVTPGTPGQAFASSLPVRVLATAAAIVASAVSVAAESVLGLPILAVVALLVAIGTATAALACWRTRTPTHELWADHGGKQVCLLQTTDRLMFGQVSRALRRVLEWSRERDSNSDRSAAPQLRRTPL
jgi:hypothetical protein